MADNVLDKYKRSYHKNVIIDGVTSLQALSVASMTAAATVINSATFGSALTGRVNVGSVEVTVTAPAVTATSNVQLTAFWMGPVSSANWGSFGVSSVNPGVGFQLRAVGSVSMATVSVGAAWFIANPA